MIKDYLVEIAKAKVQSESPVKYTNECGHSDAKQGGKGLCKNCYNKLYKQLKIPRIRIDCPHKLTSKGRKIKPYLNNMCFACCKAQGLFRQYADACEHTDRANYVKGFCK